MSKRLFEPALPLLCKLGSIMVHVEELLEPGMHEFDRIALDNLLNDPEVREWRGGMQALAMLPLKRTAEDLKLARAKEAAPRRKRK